MEHQARIVFVIAAVIVVSAILPAPPLQADALEVATTRDNVTEISFTRKMQVVVAIDAGGQLLVHCKSKDDDLGEHTLAEGTSYSFGFHLNMFGRTLFFCSATAISGGRSVSFDAYDEKRDGSGIFHGVLRCYDRCAWDVKEHDVFGYNQITQRWEWFYSW